MIFLPESYIHIPTARLFLQRNALECFPYLNVCVTQYFAHFLSSSYLPAFILSKKYLAITYKLAYLKYVF